MLSKIDKTVSGWEMQNMSEHFEKNRHFLQKRISGIKLLRQIRPQFLVSGLLRVFRSRHIVDSSGLCIYVSVINRLGVSLVLSGEYEPETTRIFRENIKDGDTVLDIGANEGYFSALAGSLVGVNGKVIAVEPQSRLLDILHINTALNSKGSFSIVHAAIGEATGSAVISLYPEAINGASGLVNRYRFGAKKETVKILTPSFILEKYSDGVFDFVKIDVEGFEPEVIEGLLPLVKLGKVQKILVDYHADILDSRGLVAEVYHLKICDAGMTMDEGSVGDG